MGSAILGVEESNRTLIIGPTGLIGQFVAEASLASGWPTYLLVRGGRMSSCKAKASAIMSLQEKGAIIVQGSVNEKATMEKILKEHKIEIVISTIGGQSILEQLVLVEAIKSVGTVKRFVPSEFGHDIDRANPVEPGLALYKQKREVRRLIERLGVPYTFICCNSIAAWPYHDNTHPTDLLPPLERFQIYGDGTVKAYFVAGSDIGKFTIKCLHDDRTLNKTIHFQPSTNLLSVNELASLWEEKIGLKLPRVTITEDDLLSAAQEMVIPQSVVAALTHDIFIKGCQVNYSLDKPTDLEVTSLYPDMPFKTVDECFGDFAKKIVDVPKKVEDSGYKVSIISPEPKPEALVLTA
ncbi:hypothetical protein BT93_K0169 [Corymbia citriodora subsp. variegata]|nr:hypothetical protein BT93_K0169 [Corymbia citriodora subsp. variegata]